MMNIQNIDAREAARLVEEGARLIDIRGRDEHAREKIPVAACHPLDSLGSLEGDRPVIFHCRSGQRTRTNADRLAKACQGQPYILDGGIEAWKAAGLPVVEDRRQPIEIMRQVQLAGGGVILLSVALTLLAGPLWSVLAAAVAAGMMHAGLTGSCAMTKLLAPMPWNRARTA